MGSNRSQNYETFNDFKKDVLDEGEKKKKIQKDWRNKINQNRVENQKKFFDDAPKRRTKTFTGSEDFDNNDLRKTKSMAT